MKTKIKPKTRTLGLFLLLEKKYEIVARQEQYVDNKIMDEVRDMVTSMFE